MMDKSRLNDNLTCRKTLEMTINQKLCKYVLITSENKLTAEIKKKKKKKKKKRQKITTTKKQENNNKNNIFKKKHKV